MPLSPAPAPYEQPSATERLFNRIFGFLVGQGLAPKHFFILQVRGRKSGKVYSTPVDVLEMNDRRYLVAPRGQTQWVRNAQAAGEITLKRGSFQKAFRVLPLIDGDKPPLLKAYLEKFKAQVQRFFPIAAGSDVEAFEGIAADYPVFELSGKE